jgi:hypothetical protein
MHTMKTHIQIAAVLNIAFGILCIVAAAAVFIFMTMASSIVASYQSIAAGSVVGLVAIAISGFLAVLGLPSVIGGFGLFVGKSWAKPLILALAVLQLVNIPFGTALGVYTLWALLYEPYSPQIEPPQIRPVFPAFD